MGICALLISANDKIYFFMDSAPDMGQLWQASRWGGGWSDQKFFVAWGFGMVYRFSINIKLIHTRVLK